ncbi:peptidase M23-like protein [Stella humosa]|uniref:Peptidase M23-like protein n=1 Tax=Stella humosa TaxID=94 RepID=A0A3N1L0Y7_9PROT|nr:M23 family metallopeptidase [Stella humosa]ROP83175.1 peptidase M23-like protein [Stella humosa]BBK30048.1 hypothetical protein STHU_06820 [Stella humosa]
MGRVGSRGVFASFWGKTSAFVLAAAIAAVLPGESPASAATAKQAITPQKKPPPAKMVLALPQAKPGLAKAAPARPGVKPLTLPAKAPAAKPTPPGKTTKAAAKLPPAKPQGRDAKGKPLSKNAPAPKIVPARAGGYLALPAPAAPAASKSLYRTASATAAPAPRDRRVIALIEDDETLIDVLVRENVNPDDLIAAVDAFEDIEERARLVRGDRIELVIDGANDAGERNLTALRVVRAQGGDAMLVRSADGTFTASEGKDTRAATLVTMTGSVSADWRASLATAEVPPALAEEVDRLLALDPDLPRPVPRGSAFEILAERRDGQDRGTSYIARYIGVRVAGHDHRIYRYMPHDGAAGYFDERGRSVAPLTLTMPVADARLTSEFGWRRHPKLKRRMFHRGIDLAAPIGTPIVASADGVVEWAGWRGAYGRYVRINHGGGLATAYGHLSDYAPGVTELATVRQGEVIGYVGSSGRSTGPHLDFSVLVDGQATNPMHALMPAPRDLRGPELTAFREHVAQLHGVAQVTP